MADINLVATDVPGRHSVAVRLRVSSRYSAPAFRPAGWWRQDHPKARSFAAAQLMNLGGIPARLLSLGTIDFGIIVNGAILMAEAILSQSEARFGESFTEDILGPRDKRK
jgi:hypothetical protein